MKYLELFLERYKEYFLSSGEPVYIGRNSHIHIGTKKYLDEIFKEIEGGEKRIKYIKEFDHIIGVSYCVEVGPEDIIHYKKRGKRKQASKMVAKREPEPSNELTVVLHKIKDHYLLITTFVGVLNQKFGIIKHLRMKVIKKDLSSFGIIMH